MIRDFSLNGKEQRAGLCINTTLNRNSLVRANGTHERHVRADLRFTSHDELRAAEKVSTLIVMWSPGSSVDIVIRLPARFSQTGRRYNPF